jgi:predicted transcriptional regulator
MTTLKITLDAGDRLRESALDRLEAAERGDEVEAVDPVLNFRTVADLAEMLTEKKLELLRAVAAGEPASISAAADLVDRDYREVHRNLEELAALNLVEFEQEGRSKRPIVPYDDIEIDIDLPTDPDPDDRLQAGAD